MHVRVMPSLGDAIYCRPFVKAFATSIETKWPALFSDLVFRGGDDRTIAPRYDSKNLALGSIPQAIGRFFPPLSEIRLDLPPVAPSGRPPYALVRAPTLRSRFYAPARNPDARYIRQAGEIVRARGYRLIGIGTVGPDEVFDGDPPVVDEAFWHGELAIEELLALVAGASLIVAGPGWTVPASMAYGVPHVIVYGGAAKWNSVDKLIDERMPKPRLATVEPDGFCRGCKDVRHDCDKRITGFEEKFSDALDHAMCL